MAAVLSSTLLRRICASQPARGQPIVTVAFPAGAYRDTLRSHFAHVPWTRSLSATTHPGSLARLTTSGTVAAHKGCPVAEHDERLRRLGVAARASEELAKLDREALDSAIEAADLADLSTREIARYSGLPPSTVHAIVIRRTAARQARLAKAAGIAT